MNRLSIILILSSILLTSCGAGKPKGGEGISYFGAGWLNNERIIYTKQVETVRFHYGWLAEVANMGSELIYTDYFICTMKPDGSELKKIGRGGHARLSPDGKLILYTASDPTAVEAYEKHRKMFPNEPPPRLQGSLWLINTDGTGKRKLVETGSHGIWSPDGKRIAYWKDKDYLIIIDSDGQNPVELTRSNYPLDWTPDGSMILVEGGFINILSVESFVKLPKLAAIPNYPRLSPDGEKIVGENAGLDADI